MIFIFIILCIPLFVSLYFFIKYRNPYRLIFIFGKKGVGKSTLLTKLAYQYSKKGWYVYSTENTPNSRKFIPSNFGMFQFPANSCVLIDEASLLWSNRDFASQNAKVFKATVERQLRLQRHDKLVIYMFSQTYDVDLKIRSLADEMYLATKLFNCITYLKKIQKSVVLTRSDSAGASRVAEDLVFEPFLLFWAGTRKLVLIPKWAKLFDSFDDMGWERASMPFEDMPKARPLFSLSSSYSRKAQVAAETDSLCESVDKQPYDN